MNEVKLLFFSKKHTEKLLAFVLPPEQEQFTALPNQKLEQIEGQFRVVIVSEDRPVGFFLLNSTERVKEFTDHADAMILTSLSINYVEQGKGFAKEAMGLLPVFLRREFPECKEICLAVNQKNLAAQQLYTKVGFVDTGKTIMGPVGEQRVLRLTL
ncbi:GNAT family N-acetyltransferase [Alkalicoccobacillus porphyridii]|uniref:GNAT family N-acetyltransferase n=1 Tax=Alkalicoccobacillus porphyridii TaxID=2597270 RepID=A0A553ZWY0_9BACI|nr:GNAT family N-acetyltransferase [Alkalicoccobacillus porphyridii]TSB45954.1 GNAT family N-acetyltransferase [Alkalicoccobacillus porphyridii]